MKLKPKHYFVEEACREGTGIHYQPSIVEERFIYFKLAEHVRQFIDLLKEAGYKEQKDD